MFYIAAIMAYFYMALLLKELNIIKKRERVKNYARKIMMPPNDKKESIISDWGDYVEEYEKKNFYKRSNITMDQFKKF
ncbi:hypothetical protein [Photobacterium leiognathi]|uniref:hypothetical protein n=1 Tax=Photobacterium leiognathi TaxID=553611 RepID=UPI002981D631|nr:hypothetical protein [Photobacterium leiognathi]